MLYLEDYLEMIEHLPQELRDRFTEMRELDLTVQNSMDVLQKKEKGFFLQCKRGELLGDVAQQEYQVLRKEYYKVMEDADEKVNIATQTHDLVERYLRRLDSELFKFKCELEADNNGITEILEKRSLEMDTNSSSAANALLNVYVKVNQKENRNYSSTGIGTSSSHLNHVSINNSNMTNSTSTSMGNLSLPTTPTSNKERYRIPKVEKRRETGVTNATVPEKRTNLNNALAATSPATVAVMRPIPANVGTLPVLSTATVPAPSAVAYNLQQIGSATNALKAAASQAIVATNQMPQGRRTASLKASYEAIHGSAGGPPEFWINTDIVNAATAAAHTTLTSTSNSVERKHKKRSNTNVISGPLPNPTTPSSNLSIASSPSVSVDSLDMVSTPSSGTSAGVGLTSLGITSTGMNISQTLNRSSTNVNTVSTPGSTISTGIAATAAAVATGTSASSNVTLNDTAAMMVDQTMENEWSYDPNEPRYCTCNQVSYGDMVACDNDACPYEWFHYPCVGITQPPKGKWYCPKCTASMRRRGNRKN